MSSVHTETYLSCFRSRDSLSLFEVECAMKPLIFIPHDDLNLIRIPVKPCIFFFVCPERDLCSSVLFIQLDFLKTQ